ncbi:MAG: SDR family oxidoreductase [Myxococcales bacterium]|nr:SDR family oxidoreductase [Myxococcales bacterium]
MPRPAIEGKIAVITGASSGIGLELAKQLAPTLGEVVLVARRKERLDALAEELKRANPKLVTHTIGCDLADLAQIDSLVEELGSTVSQVDLLVNNAGLGDICLFEFAEWPKLEGMLELNIVSLTKLTHRLLPGMLARKSGAILNVSSGFGLTFMPSVACYAASKAYVTSFSESLRSELRGTGIVVSQLCPGPVHTEFEAVAGNPTGRELPKLLTLDAATCVQSALRQFRRGKALIITGFWIRVLMWLTRCSPRLLRRAVFSPIAEYLRRRRLRHSTAG